MCVCVHVHMCACAHAHMYAHRNVHAHTRTHTHTHSQRVIIHFSIKQSLHAHTQSQFHMHLEWTKWLHFVKHIQLLFTETLLRLRNSFNKNLFQPSMELSAWHHYYTSVPQAGVNTCSLGYSSVLHSTNISNWLHSLCHQWFLLFHWSGWTSHWADYFQVIWPWELSNFSRKP